MSPSPHLSRALSYLLPLGVGAVLCAVTWPVQTDRIGEDEIREALRAFALARGEVGWWEHIGSSDHPPLVPTISALCLQFLPVTLALRMPALMAGFLTILLVVWLGRRIDRPQTGVVAGLLVASSPIWWAYANAISLDLPLAGIAAVAVVATAGPKRYLPLALFAGIAAALTKRHGLALIVLAMLLASLPGIGGLRSRRSLSIFIGTVAFGLTCVLLWLSTGHPILGSIHYLDELVDSAPRVFILAGASGAALALLYRTCPRAVRRRLRPLILFGTPLALAPLIGMYPAPRYFLPVLPVGSLVLAVVLWNAGKRVAPGESVESRPASTRVRWMVSIAVLSIWWFVQARDLNTTYWPYQRGHRDAVSWLASRVQPGDVVISPEGGFLELACLEEGVTNLSVINVDRSSCAGLEERLANVERRAWVVLPLYRDLRWAEPHEEHVAKMGLQLRALVRRDVAMPEPRPWQAASVESLGPPRGTPVMAILSAEAGRAPPDLFAETEALSLAEFDDATDFTGWLIQGVTVGSGAAGGVALAFDGKREAVWVCTKHIRWSPVFSIGAWHHHRWLELEIQATDADLELIELAIVFRDKKVFVRLSELRVIDSETGWRRLLFDLRPPGTSETSKVNRMSLSAWPSNSPGYVPRIVIKQFCLLPEGEGR